MSLKDVIGHKTPLNALKRAIQTERVASAYLFSGEEGIGKRFAAINFAKALNCKRSMDDSAGLFGETPAEEKSLDACDECPSCIKIEKGIHPDVHVISPEGPEIKIDEIRELLEVLSLTALEAGTRVVIVDSAERMNEESSNAFLKTLEEPPPHSVIILVSSNPDSMIETIRSRCLRMNFKPLSTDDTRKVLKRKLQGMAEKESRLDDIVRLSMGRPGMAIEANPIDERDDFFKTLGQILVPGSKASWKGRQDMEVWFDASFLIMRDMIDLKLRREKARLVNKDIEQSIRKMCKTVEVKVIIECYMRMSRLRDSLRFNLNKSITWNLTGCILREAGLFVEAR